MWWCLVQDEPLRSTCSSLTVSSLQLSVPANIYTATCYSRCKPHVASSNQRQSMPPCNELQTEFSPSSPPSAITPFPSSFSEHSATWLLQTKRCQSNRCMLSVYAVSQQPLFPWIIFDPCLTLFCILFPVLLQTSPAFPPSLPWCWNYRTLSSATRHKI